MKSLSFKIQMKQMKTKLLVKIRLHWGINKLKDLNLMSSNCKIKALINHYF